MKIFAFAGISASGKTRLIERLVSELKNRGYSVSVIKHCAHGFDLEAQGKDTTRFVEAGSDAVCMYSPDGQIVLQTKETDPDVKKIAQEFFRCSDFILVEGNRTDKTLRKIEVLRKGISENIICSPEELIAVVSDFKVEGNKPVFHPDEIKKIADFLENTKEEQWPQLILDIDGVSVPMNSFVQKIFASTLLGMVKSLDGVKKNPECITLSLIRKGKEDEKI
jgi:molybdopterin-guanine dinucleotide biosynthesis protein B